MKKAFIFIYILFVILCFKPRVYAYSGNGFIWNKTELYVPLYSNFEDSLDEIDVEFYFDGAIVDQKVTVELDRFYYSNLSISTNKVENKLVKICATVDGYSNYEVRDVLVHIVDIEAPSIFEKQKLVFNVGQSVSIQDYIGVSDNYKIEEVNYDFDKVNLNVCGQYSFNVYARDTSGNETMKVFDCYVKDLSQPVIEAASFIKASYGDVDFDIKDYVRASDEYDGDLTQNVCIEGLNVFKLGNQEVTISVRDSSNNTRIIKKIIEVCDTVAPTLELRTYFDTIFLDENIDNDFFKSYIKVASDDCDNLNENNVIVDTSNYKNEIGSYYIYYTLTDSYGNYSKRSLALNVTYKSEPKITINEDELIFYTNESFNLLDYIVVTDDYDTDIENSIKIDDSAIDTSKEGNYEIIISVTNKAGVNTTKSAIVRIKSRDEETSAKSLFYTVYDKIYEFKIYIVVVLLIGIGIIIYFIKKKNNHKIGE